MVTSEKGAPNVAQDSDDAVTDSDSGAAGQDLGVQPEGDQTQDQSGGLAVSSTGNMHNEEKSAAIPEDSAAAIGYIVNSNFVQHERMHMLDNLFDRTVRLLTTTMRKATTLHCDVSIEPSQTIRFGDYISKTRKNDLIGVVRATGWDGSILCVMEEKLVFGLVDVFLGGFEDRRQSIKGKDYSSIERSIAERVMNHVLSDLSQSFQALFDVTFELERTETNPYFAVITQSNSIAVHHQILMSFDGIGGTIDIITPYSTLDPVRDILTQLFLGEKFGQDPAWEEHMKAELRASKVPMVALLTEQDVTLGRILSWKPGDTIELRATSQTRAVLTCGGIPMFSARMGQRMGQAALKIEENLGTTGDMMNAVISS